MERHCDRDPMDTVALIHWGAPETATQPFLK